MPFDPLIAATRFGCGLSPVIAPPSSVPEMLATLSGPDRIRQQFPIETFDVFRKRMAEKQAVQKRARRARGTDQEPALRKQVKRINAAARRDAAGWFNTHLIRRIHTADGFRERLTAFWADHFTTRGQAGVIRRGASPYVETAIRPLIAGRFEDLLISAVTHPMMVNYLNQDRSIGENSPRAAKLHARGRKAGLNENLAREIMELHTLGVDGPYGQSDVRELAELLAGLTFDVNSGRIFVPDRAEPGAESILGRNYGGDPARFVHIETALRDLARHPATAWHMAHKLAVHFVSDTPDPNLVHAMERAYLDTGGDLTFVYQALLSHAAAWDTAPRNVKPPFDFMASALRALAVPPDQLTVLQERVTRQLLLHPLNLMGHEWERPAGPDGLFEADASWITPQAMAVRVQWAMRVPQRLARRLPDPRDFVETALGGRAPEPVRFAARNAESASEAIGLVLMSPAFQRV